MVSFCWCAVLERAWVPGTDIFLRWYHTNNSRSRSQTRSPGDKHDSPTLFVRAARTIMGIGKRWSDAST